MALKEIAAQLDASVKTRILILLQNGRSMANTISFLRKHNYILQMTSNVHQAVQAIASFQPHVVLISWELKSVDTRKTYQFFEAKFKVLTVVFSEENSLRSATAIMRSGLTHSLLPPVGGQGMHTRLQALLRARNAGRGEQVPPRAPPERRRVPPSRSPWEEMKSPDLAKRLGENDQTKIWRRQGMGKRGTKVYYFAGGQHPTYNDKVQKWDGLEGGQLYSEENDATGNNATIKKETAAEFIESNLEVENDFAELDRKLAKIKELSAIGKVDTTSDEAPVGEQEVQLTEASMPVENLGEDLGEDGPDKTVDSYSALEDACREVAASAVMRKLSVPHTSGRRIWALPVECMSFCGVIFLTSDEGQLSEEAARQFFKSITSLLLPQNLVLTPRVPLPLSIVPTFEDRDDTDTEGFAFSIFQEGALNHIVFIPFPQFPQYAKVEDYFEVPIVDTLLPQTKLFFNLYIHLPQNGKYLLYLREGTPYTTILDEKLKVFGLKNVFIKEGEKNGLLQYVIENLVAFHKSS